MWCSDQATHLSQLADPWTYDYQGGFDPTYDGTYGGSGAGFGDWQSAEGCYITHSDPGCMAVGTGLHAAWRNCPTQVAMNSYNISNGLVELWVLTKMGSYSKLGGSIRMAHYEGTYSYPGFSTDAAEGELACGSGFLIVTVRGG